MEARTKWIDERLDDRFDHIDIRIELTGPTREQADHLGERFKGR